MVSNQKISCPKKLERECEEDEATMFRTTPSPLSPHLISREWESMLSASLQKSKTARLMKSVIRKVRCTRPDLRYEEACTYVQ